MVKLQASALSKEELRSELEVFASGALRRTLLDTLTEHAMVERTATKQVVAEVREEFRKTFSASHHHPLGAATPATTFGQDESNGICHFPTIQRISHSTNTGVSVRRSKGSPSAGFSPVSQSAFNNINRMKSDFGRRASDASGDHAGPSYYFREDHHQHPSSSTEAMGLASRGNQTAMIAGPRAWVLERPPLNAHQFTDEKPKEIRKAPSKAEFKRGATYMSLGAESAYTVRMDPMMDPMEESTMTELIDEGRYNDAVPHERLDSREVVLDSELSDLLSGDTTRIAQVRGCERTMHEVTKDLVGSAGFEHAVGFLVLCNAIALGVDVEFRAEQPSEQQFLFTIVSEAFFCFIFLLEILLRIYAHRIHFFRFWADGNAWNLFDVIMVSLQLTEQGIAMFSSWTMTANLSTLRVLRLLRVIRIIRLVRTVHLFDDLRVMVSSILRSASSLWWSMVLLMMAIYIFSLILLQVILSAGDTPHKKVLNYWYRNLGRTVLTMFESIVGGVSWDEVVSPLNQDISPIMGVTFCCYIAVCVFAMMNLLTGVFVDKAMKTVREDQDMVLAAAIRDLFMSGSTVCSRSSFQKPHPASEITWETFAAKLQTDTMQDYFRQINVDVTGAQSLFDLIDLDGNGSLDAKEIVDGCLRLRGPARALDLALLMREISDMHKEQLELLQYIEREFESLRIMASMS